MTVLRQAGPQRPPDHGIVLDQQHSHQIDLTLRVIGRAPVCPLPAPIGSRKSTEQIAPATSGLFAGKLNTGLPDPTTVGGVAAPFLRTTRL
jgi:hypothetical protein